jgi:hypothetical protein
MNAGNLSAASSIAFFWFFSTHFVDVAGNLLLKRNIKSKQRAFTDKFNINIKQTACAKQTNGLNCSYVDS